MPSSTMEEKIVNDTVAWARSLAELRGRNADWAERAVKESIVATEKVALEEGIIIFVVEELNIKNFLDLGSFMGYYSCFVSKYFNQ